MSRLRSQRDQFSIPQDVHYLNCAYLGPLSKKVQDVAGQCALRQARPWQWLPRDFFEEAQVVRELSAKLIHTSARHMAIIPSVSYGVATVVKNLEFGAKSSKSAKRTIVVLDEQFPSNVYGWKGLCAQKGLTLCTVERPSPADAAARDGHCAALWNQRILDAINSSTALVAMPRVHWSDGSLFDLKAIGQKARSVGALFVLDLTQSLGALPFDQQQIQADAIFSSGYKHMMGPYGLSYAYYGTRFLDGMPLEETWLARKDSEDFSRLVDYKDAYADGASRFDVGQKSNPIMLPMMIAALESILERSTVEIQAYCKDLTDGFLDEVQKLGYKVEDPEFRSAHLFGIRLPQNIDLEALSLLLEESHIKVSIRGNALRVSPNVYNNQQDIQALFGVLEASSRGS